MIYTNEAISTKQSWSRAGSRGPIIVFSELFSPGPSLAGYQHFAGFTINEQRAVVSQTAGHQ